MGSNVDQRIALDKATHFLGTASIPFSNLAFNQSKINRSNVNRIKTLMQGGRACLPGKSNHQISAIVDKGQLEKVLLSAGISPEILLKHTSEHVKLEFPDGYQLQCLQGHHRVLAASEVMPPHKRRWVVKLFSSEIASETRRDLQEERSNEKDIEDGEFYYNIRLFEGHLHLGKKRDLRSARKWWALLAGTKSARARNARGGDDQEEYKSSKCDRLRQLFGSTVFAAAFDSFNRLPALYSGLRLSVINKMLSMICRDELLAILNDIKRFWYYVFEENEEAMEMLDVQSLRVLDCAAPGANEAERSQLGALSASRQILGSFNDTDRERVWRRICDATRDRVVPTLWGFFNNLNHLRPVAACLRRLVDVHNHSLRDSLSDNFSASDKDRCLVQVSPYLCKSVSAYNIDCFEIAYRQLWLYAWREYQRLQPTLRKKLAGAGSKPANAVILWGLARLAHKLGFSNWKIERLLQKNPYQVMALRHVRDGRIPGFRKSDAYEKCVHEVAKLYASAWEQRCNGESESNEDEDETEDDLDMEDDSWGKRTGSAWQNSKSMPTRCGLPRFEDHVRDRVMTFIQHMDGLVDGQNSDLSSFFTLRSLYSQVFSDRKIQIDFDSLLATAPHDLDQYLYHAPSHKTKLDTTAPKSGESMWEGCHDKSAKTSEAVRELEAQYRSEESKLAEIHRQIEAEEARAQTARNQNGELEKQIRDQRAELEGWRSQNQILEAPDARLRERMDKMNERQDVEMNQQEKLPNHHACTQTDLPGISEANITKEDTPKIQSGGQPGDGIFGPNPGFSKVIEKKGESKLIQVSYSGPQPGKMLIEATPETFTELAEMWVYGKQYGIRNEKKKMLNPENAYQMLVKKRNGVYSVNVYNPKGKRKFGMTDESSRGEGL